MDKIKEIKAAKKRCIAMGKFHGWCADFDKHPLAASLDNHTYCIDIECNEEEVDFSAILEWILNMAKSVNKYCDAFKVSGDAAAEYWLERFLWRCDVVCDVSYL